MDSLLWFFLFAGFFFLMMRYGCGAHVAGHGRGGYAEHESRDSAYLQGDSATPLETEIDPVCEMSVHTSSAKSAMYQGHAYYFCSADHRERFEADPERYVRSTARIEPASKEQSHD